jgi:hypothetical protein
MLDSFKSLVKHDAFLFFIFEVSYEAFFTVIHQAVFLDNLGVELLKFSVSQLILVLDFLEFQGLLI